MRNALWYLTMHCVANARIGFAGGAVSIPEMAHATVLVELLDRVDRRFVENEYKREALMALRGRSRSHRAMGGGIPNKFDATLIEVP